MNKIKRLQVFNKYYGKCAYCGETLKYNEMQVDHIRSQFHKGSDDLDNLNPSCRQCNFYKGTDSIEQFKERLTTIIERIKKPFIVRLAIKYGIVSFKQFDGRFYFEKH